ncbi:Uu.00g015200.m01.CDS01 [Anthostomella pinea]|uniref:Uu.00g015200.m01.CDS01 n=1 Tax=Anthostomella pinea TaxID=933095 RepID=A0AAI8YQH4_9PEZI|nr:Uu.00g015200.m01.CDS01 [Anthostomella pinea]
MDVGSPCKNRKVKCGEEHPTCLKCQGAGETCDYSIRLNWDGRRGKRPESGVIDFRQDAPSPTIPAKGFKLVHQYPLNGLDTPGARRLEPLINPPSQTDQPRHEARKASLSGPVTFADASTMAVGDAEFSQRPRKRAKVKPEAQPTEPTDKRPYSSHSSTVDSTTATYRYSVSSGVSVGSPLTPTTSSTYSDDDRRQSSRSDQQSVSSPDVRRLSVNSLLAGPPSLRGLRDDSSGYAGTMFSPLDTRLRNSAEPTYYGVDRGFPDRDLGKNDDMNAISGSSPLLPREFLDTTIGEPTEDIFWNEFGFGVETNDCNDEDGGYYSKPVKIYIPRNLEPLPSRLTENPMNLLYFHHFLNHTARVLVPYDDPHANPFRTILPQMAVKNDNLLALLLAYSGTDALDSMAPNVAYKTSPASHRARVLNHPEPTLRIAFWVDDIFPALRQALNDPERNFSNANLATAIMLTSLEIISPKVFGYEISWQKHLGMARELITARPGGLHGLQPHFRQDQVCSFLWSWAAYLDVIGSLSGGPKDTSSAWIFDYEVDDMMDGYDEIDCIMGFTTRCIYLLAKIADLARKCDAERIGDDGDMCQDWEPSEEVFEQARKLEDAITESMLQPPVPCQHIHKKGDIEKWDRNEMEATNWAFHWAGLVHLYRRIMGKRSEDDKVQMAVGRIISCFQRIRSGGTAESCMLFPLFTAGCDARDWGQRALILKRFVTAENHGMTQVHNARRLMQKVWETEKPWETLVSTEFIG